MPEINDAESAAGCGDDKPIIEKLQSLKVDDGFSNTSTSLNNTLSICACCGKEGSDNDMNTCNKCNSVKYCNAACKKKNRSKHKKQCEKRVAELHDEALFEQPPQVDDCPICFLRMPSLWTGYRYNSCCGKDICNGCIHVNIRLGDLCPFCRTPAPTSDEEIIGRMKKRIKAEDALAVYGQGCLHADGLHGLPKNTAKALELWHRAGELGNASAYHNIGNAYYIGNGVQRDIKKAQHYWEFAAIKGDAMARHNLGAVEKNRGNIDNALKHYMIAVKDGSTKSLHGIKTLFKDGQATKDDYTKALRLYQVYLDEIQSDQRDEAAKHDERIYY